MEKVRYGLSYSMTISDYLVESDDLSVVTGYTEHFESSTTTPDYYEITYFHVPQFIVAFYLLILGWFFSRLLIEFIKRWK